jgi:hypothetical protein
MLEEDYKYLQNKNATFKEYQFKSIQISEGYYNKLNKLNALYVDDGYLIVREGYCNYNSEKGLELKDKGSIELKAIEDTFL